MGGLVHLVYSLSSGPFLTMHFEFDQDHGPRPGPKLDNFKQNMFAIIELRSNVQFWTRQKSWKVFIPISNDVIFLNASTKESWPKASCWCLLIKSRNSLNSIVSYSLSSLKTVFKINYKHGSIGFVEDSN